MTVNGPGEMEAYQNEKHFRKMNNNGKKPLTWHLVEFQPSNEARFYILNSNGA